MFKINLENRLISLKTQEIFNKEEQLVLDEAENILEANSEEDLEILRKMGMSHSIDKAKSIGQRKNFLKGFDRTRIFSHADIKDLCLTYKLRALSIKTYKGHVDPALPSKIKEFGTIHKENGHGELKNERFMIVAPMESFDLQSAEAADPLLFYPLGDGFFYLIHKWGNDISVSRYISAWKWKTFFNWYVASLFTYWIPAAMFLSYVTGEWAWSILPIIGSGVHFLFARYCEGNYHDSYLVRRVSNEVWESTRGPKGNWR